VGVVLKFFLLIIAFYFFLRDGTRLRRVAVELSPLGDEYDEQIIGKVKQTINSVVKGFLLVAIVQGVLVGIGLAIFGVPKAALWGSAAVFSALVPGVGTALITIPAVIYLWAMGKVLAAIGLFVWAALLVGLVDNLLAPVLYSRGGVSHPFLMFLAVFGGLSLFGPVGFILGPIFLSLLFALVEIYRRGIPLQS
jgi:predicted PurR-regulated permease PerM